MKKKFIVANWKENPKTEAQALKLFAKTAKAKRGEYIEVVVCPPFIYLEEIARAFRSMKSKSHLAIGAQDIFWEEKGPYTSEVGPKMIKSLGARYAIIGHSERRKWLHETDAMINKKIKLALKDGFTIILCVGEPPRIRRKGIAAAEKFVKNQLRKDLSGVSRLASVRRRIIIAYEPIWAIGTGHYDKPEDAARMAFFIRKTVATQGSIRMAKVLYGGSVNSKNIGDYVQYEGIDGALVGGASLKAEEFRKMIIKIKSN